MSLLELLFWADGAGVSTLLLAAVHRTGVKTRVALSTDHLVAVVLLSQDAERWLNYTATKTENQVQG